MKLLNIYQPIKKELEKVEENLKFSLEESKNQSIIKIGKYLLESKSKKIRPALLILSAKATLSKEQRAKSKELIKIATAIELIHMASLIHDDVIDHACLRHNKPTINSKWGQDTSIALGDYLYSVAFDLISHCGNTDVIRCISSATKQMCEGELLQVCERDNLELLKKRYIVIVKKKTAALFAASCQAGALISNPEVSLQSALKEYGLNFGIAFQIIDDYLDLTGEEKTIGKIPGQDIGVGEATLPLLNLLASVSPSERKELKILLTSKSNKESLQRIKSRLFDSDAILKTKEAASSYITLAKKKINILSHSTHKQSLIRLADFIMERGFDGSPRS